MNGFSSFSCDVLTIQNRKINTIITDTFFRRMIFFMTLFSQVIKEVKVPFPAYSNGACKVSRWPIFKLFPVRSFFICPMFLLLCSWDFLCLCMFLLYRCRLYRVEVLHKEFISIACFCSCSDSIVRYNLIKWNMNLLHREDNGCNSLRYK